MIRRWPRALGLAAAAVVALVATAGPAAAHGVPSAGPPNWVSEITSPPTDGLTWSVVGVDAALRLTNDSPDEVLVSGYVDEPYLRIGPDGVFENARSRTAWLNRNRLGDLTTIRVPDDVVAGAPPEWVQVSSSSTWTWFDHRIHWIAPLRLDPAVEADPDSEHLVRVWTVPATQGGTSVGPTGELRWLPSPWKTAGRWALPLVAALVLGGGVALLRGRRPGLVAVAAASGGVAAVGAWHEVGTLLGLGAVAESGALTSAVLRSGVLVLVALAALAVTLRDDPRARWLVLGVAMAVAVVVGARELEALRAPVPRGPLPTPVTRALVAVALALPVSALLAAVPLRSRRAASPSSRRTPRP